jgi:hypothetical protein
MGRWPREVAPSSGEDGVGIIHKASISSSLLVVQIPNIKHFRTCNLHVDPLCSTTAQSHNCRLASAQVKMENSLFYLDVHH